MKPFAEQALSSFCVLYSEIMAEQGVKDAPSREDMHVLMSDKLFANGSYDAVSEERSFKHVSPLTSPRQQQPPSTVSFKLTSKMIKDSPLTITLEGEDTGNVRLDFPYLPGVDYSNSCQAITRCGGLFAPCLTRKSKGSDFCKGCNKVGKDGKTAIQKYGTVSQRMSTSILCYADCKGNKEISFGTYLSKRNIERSVAEKLIKDTYGDNVVLPEEYWTECKAKSSRKIKSTPSTSSDDEASVVPAEIANAVEDTAGAVPNHSAGGEPVQADVNEVAALAEETSVSDEEVFASSIAETAKTIVIATGAAMLPTAALAAEVLMTPEATDTEPEAKKKKKAGRPAGSKTKKSNSESPPKEKKQRGRPKKSVQEVVDDHAESEPAVQTSTPQETMEHSSNSAEESSGVKEESSNEFRMIVWEGKKYSIDEDNIMYIIEDDEPHMWGSWDPVTGTGTKTDIDSDSESDSDEEE